MHVLFIEPSFPYNQRKFVHGLRQIGARITGIGEAPREQLTSDLREALYGYEQVPSVTHKGSLYETVRRIQEREWVDRLEATVEAHILPAAEVRESCSIPGTSTKTAFLCRDKPAMKEVLRDAGVPCARSTGATSAEQVREFAKEVDFPIILKPRDAAGASGTIRAGDADELEHAIRTSGVDRGLPVAVEEFVEGHEGFYDTLCINGNIVHDFACHYFPNVLEAMRERWISPQIITTNRLSDETYNEVKEMGRRVIEVLGIETSATHMEWFFGPKGLKFSEIGCRPPGIGAWDLYCEANEFDLYKDWASAVCHGEVIQSLSRRYCTGIINLRPERDGTISHYERWEEFQQQFPDNIIDYHFPPPGSQTQGVEAGYMANAWIRLRDPNYDRLRELMNMVGEKVRVRVR